jgi:hypothetical protein
MPLPRASHLPRRLPTPRPIRLPSRASPACAFQVRRRVCPVLAPSLASRRTMATASPATPAEGDAAAAGAISPDADNTSGVTGTALEARLREAVGAEHVEVQDISGKCGLRGLCGRWGKGADGGCV